MTERIKTRARGVWKRGQNKRRPSYWGACRDAAHVLYQEYGWLLTMNNDRARLLERESAVHLIALMFGVKARDVADDVDTQISDMKENLPNGDFWDMRRQRGA